MKIVSQILFIFKNVINYYGILEQTFLKKYADETSSNSNLLFSENSFILMVINVGKNTIFYIMNILFLMLSNLICLCIYMYENICVQYLIEIYIRICEWLYNFVFAMFHKLHIL